MAKNMLFKDITHDKETNYRLGENEKAVFFLLNRSGELTFELAGRHAAAHVFAFANASGEDKQALTITQKHLAPDTVSKVLVKSTLADTAEVAYTGLITITKEAMQSDASQESRSLLLSPLAKASSKPSLEILADDVACHHAATVSPLSEETLFLATSRGLSRKQATELLVTGFFQEALDRMAALGVDTESLKAQLTATHS